MSLPQQTFTTIGQLIAYINQFIIPNGVGEITGEEHNNVENALANFIVQYTLNSTLGTIISGGGVIALSTPINIFTGVPSSVNWGNNVQYEYYIINATDTPIPITSGFFYTDAAQTILNSFPARTVVHLSKMSNGTWIQTNNIGGSGGTVNWSDIVGKPQTYQFYWVVGGTNNFSTLPGPPVPPIAGASTLVSSLLAGYAVRVSRNTAYQMGINPANGNTYFTKNVADSFVTFSPALAAGEEMIVETIPL